MDIPDTTTPLPLTPEVQTALRRFRDEVYSQHPTIDAHRDHDWHDIALGFLLACKVPLEVLTWTLLANVANGYFDQYLQPPELRSWLLRFFITHRKILSITLGHGWTNHPGGHPEAWMDAETTTGEHLSTRPPDDVLVLPQSVQEWVLQRIPLGESFKFDREVFRPLFR